MAAFRPSTAVHDVKFKNTRAMKFWRYVLVDHPAQDHGESCYRGIGWFVKVLVPRAEEEEINTADLIFNSQTPTDSPSDWHSN